MENITVLALFAWLKNTETNKESPLTNSNVMHTALSSYDPPMLRRWACHQYEGVSVECVFDKAWVLCMSEQ